MARPLFSTPSLAPEMNACSDAGACAGKGGGAGEPVRVALAPPRGREPLATIIGRVN